MARSIRPNVRPTVVVIGGPNGAGKTTISRAVIASIGVPMQFVNADVIAQGLGGTDPDKVALAAGRMMLTRLHQLADAKESFAFESTLASRSFAPFLAKLSKGGYMVHLVYSWVHSPEISIARIKTRVRNGGHFVPDNVVRRRFARSARNLIRLYIPLASRWRVYDNSSGLGPTLVGRKTEGGDARVLKRALWARLTEIADEGPDKSG
jgi:predicted ABC-type ATPase